MWSFRWLWMPVIWFGVAACGATVGVDTTSDGAAPAAPGVPDGQSTEATVPPSTPSPSPTATPTAVPSPTPEPTATPTPEVLPDWLGRADALISVFENSTTELQYGYVSELGDGRGITAGRAGFTSATGDLVLVVQAYYDARPDTLLAIHLPELERLAREGSADTSNLAGFAELWAAAAEDPAMREVQDAVTRELYFFPSQAVADEIGAVLPLTRAALYGTGIQHGVFDDPDGLLTLVAEATAEAGGDPASGVDEEVWLETFLRIRKQHLENAFKPATREVWRASAGRVDTWLDLLARGLVQLDEPFTAVAFGGEYSIP